MSKIALPQTVENNARLKCSAHVPLKNIKIVDTKQGIWRGERIIEPGSRTDEMLHQFFWRLKKGTKPEDLGEIDRMYPEFHVHDAGVLGEEFWLIPKQRILFGYDPPSSSIFKAPIPLSKGGPFRGG
jgi:hypothetical protein